MKQPERVVEPVRTPHLEGKERQYALAQHASQLGFHKVIVIDEDLGRSGAGTQERPGFGRLLASVCQGLAGAVLALDSLSRLKVWSLVDASWVMVALRYPYYALETPP